LAIHEPHNRPDRQGKAPERDLDLNPPSLAIVLDLLDEIDDLSAQLE
jgi:hypothetical protein